MSSPVNAHVNVYGLFHWTHCETYISTCLRSMWWYCSIMGLIAKQ